MKYLYIPLLLLTFSLNSLGQRLEKGKEYNVVCVGFYNLENLFDTLVDPDTSKILQEDFTPHGPKAWNTEKYNKKLEKMATAISKIGTNVNPDGPAVLGVSEIENRQVLEDLVKMPQLASRNYKIIHYESPDRRGIDVALLYQEKYFTYKSSATFNVKLEGDPDYRTRNQLLVTGEIDGEEFHFMVVHWPSRRGGEFKSRPKRVAAAETGKAVIDSILKVNPKAKLIYMGDLNDDPNNVSLTKGMKSQGDINLMKKKSMYNPAEKLWKDGIGTLAYKHSWNLFDQMLCTNGLVETGSDFSTFKYYKMTVFNEPFLKQQEGQFKGCPLRTYSFGQWINGYSDHFPVFLTLVKEKK